MVSTVVAWNSMCFVNCHRGYYYNIMAPRYKLNFVFAGLQTLFMARYNYMYFSIN